MHGACTSPLASFALERHFRGESSRGVADAARPHRHQRQPHLGRRLAVPSRHRATFGAVHVISHWLRVPLVLQYVVLTLLESPLVLVLVLVLLLVLLLVS